MKKSEKRLHQGVVSILTGPEGPVLPAPPRHIPRCRGVSILTGPEGPVLLDLHCRDDEVRACFNPHRARRPGATPGKAQVPARPPRFNPHRARRPGATPLSSQVNSLSIRFQSSPGPKARCYEARRGPFASLAEVSILTGPEGPVLLASVE